MTDMRMLGHSYLLERAAQCRKMVRQARSRGIATELESLASDYDRDAARLEVSGHDHDRFFDQ